MKIGLIAAMDEELDILLKDAIVEKKETKAQMNFIVGKLYDKEVVIVRCGIGKVNSAICTQILIDDYDVKALINVGIAGGIGENIVPGDVVIADDLVQHDVDAVAFGYKLGEIPRLDTIHFECDKKLVELAANACNNIEDHNNFVGRIATGDQFIASGEKIDLIIENFGAIACEMEGGSIAQVAYLNNIPFVVIRSISDNANSGAHMDYEKFQDIAIKNSSTIIKNMFSSL